MAFNLRPSNLLHITLTWTHMQCKAMQCNGGVCDQLLKLLHLIFSPIYKVCTPKAHSFIHSCQCFHHLFGQTSHYDEPLAFFKIDRYSAKVGWVGSPNHPNKSHVDFVTNFLECGPQGIILYKRDVVSVYQKNTAFTDKRVQAKRRLKKEVLSWLQPRVSCTPCRMDGCVKKILFHCILVM